MGAGITANQGVQAVVFGASTANVTVNVAAGNAIFICFSSNSSESPFSITDNVGNTYTATTGGPFIDTANGWAMNCFWCANSIGHITTVTIHESGSGDNGVFSYCEITGAIAASFVDAQLGAAGSSPANYDNVSVTPSQSGDLVITVIAKSSSQALTIGGGFTSLQSFSTTRTQDLGFLANAPASAASPSWTGASGGGVAFTIAIKSAPTVFAPLQTSSAFLNTVTSGTVALSGVTAGNLLTLHLGGVTPASGASQVQFSVVDSSGQTWLQGEQPAGNNAGGIGSAVMGVWFLPNANSGTHTLTISCGGFSQVTHAFMSEWAGLGSTITVDQNAFSNATTAQTNTSGTTPITRAPVELVLAAVVTFPGAGNSGIAITDPPTGFQSLFKQNVTNAGDVGIEFCYKLTSTAAAQSASWSWADSTTLLSQGGIVALQLGMFGNAVSSSSSSGALSTAIKLAGAAAAATSATGLIQNFTNVTLTAPLYTGVGGVLDPNFWLDSVPGVGTTIFYDSTFITILPDGEIVSTSNNCQAVVQFQDSQSNFATGLVVLVPQEVGYVDVSSAFIASLSTAINLQGAANSLASATGALGSQTTLQGVLQSFTNATGNLSTAIQLAAAAIDQSSAAGTLNTNNIAGALVSTTTASGLLNTQITLMSAAASVVSAAGALATAITLFGQALSTTSASGTLQSGTLLSGAIAIQNAVTGSLLTQVKLAGAAASVVSAAGALTTHIQLLGAAVSTSQAQAALLTLNSLQGAAQAVSVGTGQLTTLIELQGTVWVNAIATGALATGSILEGNASDVSIATGQFSAPGSPVGLYIEDPAFVLAESLTQYTEQFPQVSPLESVVLAFDFTDLLAPGEFLEGIIGVAVGCSAGSDPNLPSDLLNGVAAYNVAETHVDLPIKGTISGNDYYISVTAPVTTADRANPFKVLTRYGLLPIRG